MDSAANNAALLTVDTVTSLQCPEPLLEWGRSLAPRPWPWETGLQPRPELALSQASSRAPPSGLSRKSSHVARGLRHHSCHVSPQPSHRVGGRPLGGKGGLDVGVGGSFAWSPPSSQDGRGSESGRARLKVTQGRRGRAEIAIGQWRSPRTLVLVPLALQNEPGPRDCHLPRLPSQALLDLGGSPNYKDRRGLTPLFHTAMVGGDPRCCELLLYNRAQLGIADENGWQEIHQVRLPGPGGGHGGGAAGPGGAGMGAGLPGPTGSGARDPAPRGWVSRR